MTRYYMDLPVLDRTDPVASYRLDTTELMSVTGQNIGNLAFRHALRFIVDDIAAYRLSRYPGYLAAARAGEISATVVSCANWLGTSERDEAANANRADTFAATDAPTVCFGLGVQAPHGAETVDLGPNTQRLAHVLSERARLLSVRDEVTQATLERYGITNTVVTGCPSNFINGDPDLGQSVAARAGYLLGRAQGWDDLRSLICEFSGGNAASGAVLRTCLRLMDSAPAFYMLQSPVLLPFVLRENRRVPDVYASNNPFPDEPGRLSKALSRSCLHFSSIEAWMDFARSCDLSFGMRIHGNMVPLQAGVPSILISHDSRTAGLGGIMGIPRIAAADFAGDVVEKPHRLLEIIAETMQHYDAHRHKLARVMHDYVTTNGLTAHPSLSRLAGY